MECIYCYKCGNTKENCFILKNNEARPSYKPKNPRLHFKYSCNGNNSNSNTNSNQSHTYGQYNPFMRAQITLCITKEMKSNPANPFK